MSQKTKQILLLIFGFFSAILLDQWTKKTAVYFLKNKPPYPVLDGIFEFLYSENKGAAFGILQGRQWFFMIITICVLAFVIFIILKTISSKRYFWLNFTLMLLSAGAVGNMIDRIRLGYVVDFLYIRLINFPIFNVADCYVTLSAVGLILLFMFYYTEEELNLLMPFHKEKQS